MYNFIKRKIPLSIKAKLIYGLSKIKLLFLKKDIGKNSYIDKSVNVFGWAYVSIGQNTLVGEQSWLNVNGRKAGFKHIKIGSYCYLGRRNLLSSGKELIISDYVMISNECKFIGSNHIFDNPMYPYITTGTTNDDIQKIGVNCWIGAGSIVLGAITVGHGSIIGAGSVVTKDIPPFSIAVGNPCQVIKRYDFEQKRWTKMVNFDSTLEKLMPNEEEYLKSLQKDSTDLSLPIMAATSRYGDLY
jgi:acetyltransferase-like isoleucine patch superfamily enzyme